MLDHIKFRLMIRKIQCYHGFYIWHQLIAKHPEIKNTAVILLPSSDDTNNYYALLYANQGITKMERDNAVILTFDKRVMASAKNFSNRIVNIIPFSRKRALALMRYASLYNFDDRLVIASLDEPSGRNGRDLVGIKGITEEEIFAVGVYKCYPFKKETPVTFAGSKFE